ncbi:hypothetical protein GDO81_016271 [Engystomops pustulosus]|uniref:IRF tryptophan pentad repeat domain-containing protein n=2 Tax=Engystomops pustulosus TaxID=76066 RepID=A0AAV7AVI5_ENGPU|nr:hypothetical protein GDO81_016271 [Engystomops pustulosus]
MPRRELFGPWLLRQINSNNYGVHWLDSERTLFRLPWKHLNMKNRDERDYGIFKAWAICSGKYNEHFEDPPTWKTNFRCALNQVPYRGAKMFTEHEDHSGDQRDPHKIYRFNGEHKDQQAAIPNSSFSEPPRNAEGDQNLLNELNQEDYSLRISPDCVLDAPFSRPEESEVIEELIRNILLDSTEDSIQHVLNLSQDDYVQSDLHVDQVFRTSTHEQWTNSQLVQSCVVNGHKQCSFEESSNHIPVYREQCTSYHYQNGYLQNIDASQVYQQSSALPLYQQPTTIQNGFASALHETQVIQHNGFQKECTRAMAYNTPNNGCHLDESRVGQGITTSPSSYCTAGQACARSSPVVNEPTQVNGSAPETQALLNLQRSMPPFTSWEVTIYYRGKEVLKQNVSKKFVITRQDIDRNQLEGTDAVQFPSTDVLVDHLQVEYTENILSCVGKGLFIEVNPENFKVYATRMGNSRVFWSLSETVEAQETSSQAKKLVRDAPTEVFDFSQFWEDIRGYNLHKRPSPDYTIYMTFGQVLFEPVMKKLVLVKLVPNLCTFLHQAAQQNGASSLHSEAISLQISNGSSFNSFDLREPCFMEIDFQDLVSGVPMFPGGS